MRWILGLCTALLLVMPTGAQAEAPQRKFKVTAQIEAGEVTLGQTKRITGTVRPKTSGRVRIQVLRSSKWTTIAQPRITAKGTFSYRIRPTQAGVSTYRVLKPGTKKRKFGVSQRMRINTYRWHYLTDLTVDYSQVDLDQTVEVNGTRYPRSIAFTQWAAFDGGYAEFNLSRKCSQLSTVMGMEDSARAKAYADMTIHADGVELWSWGFKLGQHQVVNRNIRGYLRLRIEGTYDMDGHGSGGPAAGRPRVLCSF